MMWLGTLALLISALCVWQLAEGRPPAIPRRHHFNKVQNHGGLSFIQKAKIMYNERHLQNRIIHKENSPPREFSIPVQQRRFKTNDRPQSNLPMQSPRASPLMSRKINVQTNSVSQNIPTLGDAIKHVVSGSLEEHINNDLKKLFPAVPTTTTVVPIVDIALDFGHPVTQSFQGNQAINIILNKDISNARFSDKNGLLDSIPTFDVSDPNIQEKTIILASPDYPESVVQTFVLSDSSFPEQNSNSNLLEHSASLDVTANTPVADIPAIVIPDSGFPEPDFPPDFPDYSDVIATSPEKPMLEIPDSGFPKPNFPTGFPDYSDTIGSGSSNPSVQGFNDFIIPESGFPEPNFPPDYSDVIPTSPEKPTLEIPDSGFPEPNFPTGFPDYSDTIGSGSNNPSGQGFNDFIIPESGFPEPNFPPDFPDYSSSVDNINTNTKPVSNTPSGQRFSDFIIPDSGFPEPDFPPDFPDYSSSVDTIKEIAKPVSNNPSGQGFADFVIPDSGFPEPNYPPDFPDYSSSVDTIKGNENTGSNSQSGQGFADFVIPDSGFPEPNFPPDFPDYSSSLDTKLGNTKSNGPSPDYNSNYPDYNAPFHNFNAPSQDYNAPSPDYNSPSSPDYPQASAPNLDYPSIDYNLDNPNNAAQGRTIRNQQDLFNLVRISLLEQLSNGGRSSASKSLNNPGIRNPLEELLSFGQDVVNTASGNSRALFGTGREIMGVAHDTFSQTFDAVSRGVDEIAREVLRSIKLIGGEIQFIANDSLQATLQNLQKTSEIATSVGGDFYRASLQISDMFGRFIGNFIENVARFASTAINRTVDGALKQAVMTGEFIGDLKGELLKSIVDSGSAAQQLVQRSLQDTGNFVSGMGGVTSRFTNSATRSITGIIL